MKNTPLGPPPPGYRQDLVLDPAPGVQSLEETLEEIDALAAVAGADDKGRDLGGGGFRLGLPPALMEHIRQMAGVEPMSINDFIVEQLEDAMRHFDPPITEESCQVIDAQLGKRHAPSP
jgi:hypothetical protein